MSRLICFVIGYLFGMIPTGYLIGRMNGIDIRTKGSGNIGSTNMERTLGMEWALVTLAGDFLKVIIALFITGALYRDQADMRYLLALITGFGAMIGHSFPATLGFKGGKGVATAGGLIIYLGIRVILPVFGVFIGVVAGSRHVSLGSIVASVTFAAVNIFLILAGIPAGWNGVLTMGPQYRIEGCIIAAAIAVLVISRHRANIARLRQGNENSIHFKWKREV